jgi:hypothetical protein
MNRHPYRGRATETALRLIAGGAKLRDRGLWRAAGCCRTTLWNWCRSDDDLARRFHEALALGRRVRQLEPESSPPTVGGLAQ